MRAQLRALCPAFLLAAALGGCGGSGEGLDSNGRPIESSGSTTAPIAADFQSIQQHVFTPICSVCHAGASAPQGLRLDAANSYSLLVSVPSTEVPAVQRVTPGNPDNSYLIQKLEGHASVGARMPLGGPYLEPATIAVIRQWITDGAKRPAAAATTNALAVVAAIPAPGDVVPAAPTQVVVEFSGELDPAATGMPAVRLERVESGHDAAASANPVLADVAVPIANPQALLVTPRTELAPGHYRLVMTDDSFASVGNFAGSPSDATRRASAERTLTEFDVEGQP